MQSYLSRRSRERGSSRGEFCKVISTLTRDLTKAHNQLVRLMQQVSPGGARLYGGYSIPQEPLRPHTTPCVGSNARSGHRAPAPGNLGWSYACGIAPIPPRRPCQPMIVHEAGRFGQPQQRALLRSQQTMPKCCERPHNKGKHYRERQCNRIDTSDTSALSERSEQRDSTCVNIIFNSPNSGETPRRPQRGRRDTNASGDSKPTCLQDFRNPARLQGGGSSRRHSCVGTQFATLLQDVTSQLRVRRLAADPVKTH